MSKARMMGYTKPYKPNAGADPRYRGNPFSGKKSRLTAEQERTRPGQNAWLVKKMTAKEEV